MIASGKSLYMCVLYIRKIYKTQRRIVVYRTINNDGREIPFLKGISRAENKSQHTIRSFFLGNASLFTNTHFFTIKIRLQPYFYCEKTGILEKQFQLGHGLLQIIYKLEL